MDIYASRSDIEKYVMTRIVEIDKQATANSSPKSIVISNIIPDEWLSSDFSIKLDSGTNTGNIRLAKKVSRKYPNLDTYVYQLQKALLIVVALLERLHNEKHIILARSSDARTTNEKAFGATIDKSLLSDNPLTISYPELTEKLLQLMVKEIVPMTSLFERVENNFKTDSQIIREIEDQRHNDVISLQQQQNAKLNKQQHWALGLAVFSVIVSCFSAIFTAISTTKIENSPLLPLNVSIVPNVVRIDSIKNIDSSFVSIDTSAIVSDSSKIIK